MKSILLFLPVCAFAQTYINGGRTVEGAINYCDTAGAANVYACSLTPAIAGYSTGAVYHFRAGAANTGASTINFNSAGARAIRKNGDQDLAAGDIKAGQMVAVAYDGSFMQMLSQTGAAAAGGGGAAPTVISTTGQGYWSPFGDGAGTFVIPNLNDRDLRLWQVVLPYKAVFGKVVVHVTTPSGASCSGGTCGLVVGLYNASCGALMASGRATSGGSPDIATSGVKAIALSSAVTLDPGPYYLGVASDSAFLALTAKDIHGSFMGLANASATRFGVGANPASGNGGGLTLPSSCGAINVAGQQAPVLNLWER